MKGSSLATTAVSVRTDEKTDPLAYRDESGKVDPTKAQSALERVIEMLKSSPEMGKEILDQMVEDFSDERIKIERRINALRRVEGSDYKLTSLRELMKRLAALINRGKKLLATMREGAQLSETATVGA